MAIITCSKCQATSACGEIENGEYRWEYNDEMVLRCQEMHGRRQAGENSIPVGCSEIDKAARAFIDKAIADKSVQAAKNILSKAMHPALAKDHAALAKAIQTAAASRSRPQSPRQKARDDQQPDWDQVYKTNYVTKITSSPNWFREANKLLAAAEFLAPSILEWWAGMQAALSKEEKKPFPEHEFQTTYMMLCSYAIENFCKGWLASRLPSWERERLERLGSLPKSLEGHDLFSLVQKIGMPVIEHDEELLRRLTLSAVWQGRYPIPLHYRGGEEEFKDGKRYNLQILSAGDIPRIKELVQRLRQHVNAPDTYLAPRSQREKEKKSDESE
jgi:hypothetical protein